MHQGRTTLSKFLIQQLKGTAEQSDLAALLVDIAAAVKAISAMTAKLGPCKACLKLFNADLWACPRRNDNMAGSG